MKQYFMQSRNSEMMGYLMNEKFSKAVETLHKMKEEGDYSDIDSVRMIQQ
jgi:pentatricopeptide repeat protein